MWIVFEYMTDSEGLKDERKVISLTRYKDDALRIIKAARNRSHNNLTASHQASSFPNTQESLVENDYDNHEMASSNLLS